MKARQRFIGLLGDVSLEPNQTQEGKWLLQLFDRLQPDYTPGKVHGGHDMNTHILFMVILAVRMAQLLGARLGCVLAHLIAAVLLHELDHILSLKTDPEDDPSREIFRENIRRRFWELMAGCPFGAEAIRAIWEAVENHHYLYNESIGSQLQRSLQQLDMITRMNVLVPIVAGAHHGHYAELVNLDVPWLENIPPEERFGKKVYSISTHLLGVVVKWYDLLPEEVRPLADPFMPGLINYIRELGKVTAYITGEKDNTERDLALTLPPELLARFS